MLSKKLRWNIVRGNVKVKVKVFATSVILSMLSKRLKWKIVRGNVKVKVFATSVILSMLKPGICFVIFNVLIN